MKNKFLKGGMLLCFSIGPLILAILLFDIFSHGFEKLSLSYFIDAPLSSGRAGGIGPIILSTVLIVAIALIVAIPLGLATAIMLSEFCKKNQFAAPLVRRTVEILAGVPSIVFGLFGNAFFCIFLGLGFSILSGGLTLACMALPIIIRTTEESLRSVPASQRLGISALGFSKSASLFHLLLPIALPGLLVGSLLGFGRAIAETAALIFTSGYVDRAPESLLDSGRSLSVHIYDLAMNIPGGDKAAYSASLVLILFLIVVSLAFHWVAREFLKRRMIRA